MDRQRTTEAASEAVNDRMVLEESVVSSKNDDNVF